MENPGALAWPGVQKFEGFVARALATGFNLLQSLAQSCDVTVKFDSAQDVRRNPSGSNVTVARV